MKTIVIINGPNLNLLGKRETSIYGSLSFDLYLEHLREKYPDIVLKYLQSNHEGVLIDTLQEYGYKSDHGIILNAGGYTHTSIAIMDCIRAIETPVVEVHISDIYQRESFRHFSYISSVAVYQVIGEGLKGYDLAIDYLSLDQ